MGVCGKAGGKGGCVYFNSQALFECLLTTEASVHGTQGHTERGKYGGRGE